MMYSSKKIKELRNLFTYMETRDGTEAVTNPVRAAALELLAEYERLQSIKEVCGPMESEPAAWEYTSVLYTESYPGSEMNEMGASRWMVVDMDRTNDGAVVTFARRLVRS